MKKLLLSVAVIATMGLSSCGGEDKKEAGPTACSCLKDMTELGEKMMNAGTDAKAIQAELAELQTKCTEAATKDPEAWAKAYAECK